MPTWKLVSYFETEAEEGEEVNAFIWEQPSVYDYHSWYVNLLASSICC